jgi:NTE family protein
MLDTALDVFRMRQYFNVITRGRQWVDGLRSDAGLLDDLRRAMLPLPTDRAVPARSPFPPLDPFRPQFDPSQRVAIVATGGSGALASIVGVARAFEEGGLRPSMLSVCSGSALFGFPLAAGLPAEEVAAFTLSLRPRDYLDVDWRRLLTLVPTLGRGFGGILRGEALEATYRRLLGDLTLGELPIPAYAPIWNIEANRVEYLGPRTYPDVPVARAVRLAVALPLFIAPVEQSGRSWCDGGIVDIFPVPPVLDLDDPPDAVVAVNGFYPPGFAGEDATGWQDRPASILHIASQVRTCQQVQLAREHLARLRAETEVLMLEPVEYLEVQGVGFYRQFLSTRNWPRYMRAGRVAARRALRQRPSRSSAA